MLYWQSKDAASIWNHNLQHPPLKPINMPLFCSEAVRNSPKYSVFCWLLMARKDDTKALAQLSARWVQKVPLKRQLKASFSVSWGIQRTLNFSFFSFCLESKTKSEVQFFMKSITKIIEASKTQFFSFQLCFFVENCQKQTIGMYL